MVGFLFRINVYNNESLCAIELAPRRDLANFQRAWAELVCISMIY